MTKTSAQHFPGDPPVTGDLVREHGINEQEFGAIRKILGREPTFTELGIFSALWSEHAPTIDFWFSTGQIHEFGLFARV